MPSLNVGVTASSVFTPLDLGVTMWFDASDTTTITSSGSPAKVSEWRDKSGNAYHFSQTTSGNQPTTNANTINGLNVLTFSPAATSWMATPTGFNPSTNGISLFVVSKANDTAVDKPLLAQEDTGGTGRTWFLTSSTEAYATAIGGTRVDLTNSNSNTALNRITCASGSSQTLSLVQNGGANSLTATRTIETTTGRVVVGSGKAKVVHFDGLVAEIIVFGKVLSAGEITLIETYLNTKWSIY